MAHGGSCVARHGGRLVFVRHALPGERVRAVITEVRSQFARADAIEALQPSPHRVAPPCPWAGPGLCGGCDWQHADLAEQRRLKAAVVTEQIRHLANVDVDVVVEPVPGDDAGLGWRTRVQYAVDAGGRAGLRRHRSHDIAPIDWCRIASPGVVELGIPAYRWPGVASVEAIAGSADDRAVVVTPARRKAKVGVPAGLVTSVMRADDRGEIEVVQGRPGVRESVLGRTFWVGGSGFWQVHPGAAQTLAGAVVEALAPQSGDLALDLYAGVGLFAAALAPHVLPRGEVIAIEGSPRSVTDARTNLRDLSGVRVHEGRVDTVLGALGLGASHIVVLDPPRTGAGADVVRRIVALSPRTVAYVACDPSALARDLATFAELGYRLRSLRAFDLFPMTHHVECVATITPV